MELIIENITDPMDMHDDDFQMLENHPTDFMDISEDDNGFSVHKSNTQNNVE